MREISHAHIVSLMYKQLTTNEGRVDLSLGFDRNRGNREQKLFNNETMKVIYQARIMPVMF